MNAESVDIEQDFDVSRHELSIDLQHTFQGETGGRPQSWDIPAARLEAGLNSMQ